MKYGKSRTSNEPCYFQDPKVKTSYPNKKACCDEDREIYIDTHNYDQSPLENRQIPYKEINKAYGGNSLSRLDLANHIVNPQKEKIIHPIVNLCEPYIETVFYQYDSAPGTNNEMIWHNNKEGRIISFTYFLDSSAGDSVTVYIEKITPNGQVENILNTPANGNNYIKGTFNSTVLDFKMNMRIKDNDMIKVRFINASASDVTIMAKMDLKYDEEDFKTK
jgi:hypothetical protein